jgi:HPt (histidine-containing phosphotransfer) domain-containing protein
MGNSQRVPAAQAAAPKPEPQAPAGTVASNPKYKALLEKFISRLPERVSAMTRLLQEENLVELERAVHQLKGAGHGYGFTGITEIAARAEQRIRAKADLPAVKAEVDELVRLIRSVQGYDPRREAAAPPADTPASHTAP